MERPSSTSTSSEHAEGQSCGQTVARRAIGSCAFMVHESQGSKALARGSAARGLRIVARQ
jgi:hypothetical protein